MPTKTSFLIACAAVLFGCTNMGIQSGQDDPCTKPVCEVWVYVSAGANPTISVNLPTLRIASGNHGQGQNGVIVRWVLKDSADYTFREDSIQFYDPNYPNQFDDHQLEPHSLGNQFHWRDQNTDALKWGYQIKVYNRKTGTWTPLDPWIQNG